MSLWYVGALLSVFGSVGSNLGVNVQKYSFVKNEKLPAEQRKAYAKQKLWWLGLALVIGGSVADLIALGMAAQSMVAPIGSTTLVANLFFAHYWLHERLSRKDVLGTFFIIGGSIMTVAFGDHQEKSYGMEELKKLFRPKGFQIYAVFVTVICVVLALIIRRLEPVRKQLHDALHKYHSMHNKRGTNANMLSQLSDDDIRITALERQYKPWEKIFPLCFCALSGIMGAQSVLFAKMFAELMNATFQGHNQLIYPYPYIFAACMMSMVFGQLHYLAKGLSMFDALYVVPIFQCFWIVGGCIGGGAVFREFDLFDTTQWILFPFGILLTIAGVLLLCYRVGQDKKARVVPLCPAFILMAARLPMQHRKRARSVDHTVIQQAAHISRAQQQQGLLDEATGAAMEEYSRMLLLGMDGEQQVDISRWHATRGSKAGVMHPHTPRMAGVGHGHNPSLSFYPNQAVDWTTNRPRLKRSRSHPDVLQPFSSHLPNTSAHTSNLETVTDQNSLCSTTNNANADPTNSNMAQTRHASVNASANHLRIAGAALLRKGQHSSSVSVGGPDPLMRGTSLGLNLDASVAVSYQHVLHQQTIAKARAKRGLDPYHAHSSHLASPVSVPVQNRFKPAFDWSTNMLDPAADNTRSPIPPRSQKQQALLPLAMPHQQLPTASPLRAPNSQPSPALAIRPPTILSSLQQPPSPPALSPATGSSPPVPVREHPLGFPVIGATAGVLDEPHSAPIRPGLQRKSTNDEELDNEEDGEQQAFLMSTSSQHPARNLLTAQLHSASPLTYTKGVGVMPVYISDGPVCLHPHHHKQASNDALLSSFSQRRHLSLSVATHMAAGAGGRAALMHAHATSSDPPSEHRMRIGGDVDLAASVVDDVDGRVDSTFGLALADETQFQRTAFDTPQKSPRSHNELDIDTPTDRASPIFSPASPNNDQMPLLT